MTELQSSGPPLNLLRPAYRSQRTTERHICSAAGLETAELQALPCRTLGNCPDNGGLQTSGARDLVHRHALPHATNIPVFVCHELNATCNLPSACQIGEDRETAEMNSLSRANARTWLKGREEKLTELSGIPDDPDCLVQPHMRACHTKRQAAGWCRRRIIHPSRRARRDIVRSRWTGGGSTYDNRINTKHLRSVQY